MQNVNGLEITDVKLKKLNNAGRILGVASITLNDCFVIHNIRLSVSDDKRLIYFPQKQLPDGRWVDLAHPIKPECRQYIQDYLFELYDK